MREKITIGIIGCGMAAEYHIKGLLRDIATHIKWICDISEKSLYKLNKKYPFILPATDYQQILQDPDVDAVVISTPPSSHFKILMDSLRAKKNILVEKPMTVTRTELRLLSKTIEEYPNLFIMDCSARHSRLQPKFEYFRSMVRSGELGKVYAIHHNAVSHCSRPGIEYHPEAKWFQNKSISGGGPLIDWGVYDLSFHLGIMGDTLKPTRTRTFLIEKLDQKLPEIPGENVEDHAITFLEFDDDLSYYWERSTHAYNEEKNETRIYGTKGGLKFSYLSWEKPEFEYYYTDQMGHFKKEICLIDMKGHVNHEDDFYSLDQHFIDCVLKRNHPILPLKTSTYILNMIFDCLDDASIIK